MPKFLNEKTLEINVCGEFKNFFVPRGYDIVWRALSQKEENRMGADVATAFPGGRVIFIQWKAVKLIDRIGRHKYKLDDLQMQKLIRLSRLAPRSVYYGFPQVSDWGSYRRQAFRALPNTRFLDVSQLRGHPSLGAQLSHTATLSIPATHVTVTSEPVTCDAKSVHQIFGMNAQSRTTSKNGKSDSSRFKVNLQSLPQVKDLSKILKEVNQTGLGNSMSMAIIFPRR